MLLSNHWCFYFFQLKCFVTLRPSVPLGPVWVCVCVRGGGDAQSVWSPSSPPPQRRTVCAHARTHMRAHVRTHTRALSRSGMDVSGSEECAQRLLCIFHIKSSLGTAATSVKWAAARRVLPVAHFKIRAAQICKSDPKDASFILHPVNCNGRLFVQSLVT